MKRHITIRLALWLFIASVFSFGLSYGLYFYEIPLPYALSAGAIFLILLISIIVFLLIARPLGKITKQVKALLSGKPYNKLQVVRKDEYGLLSHFFNEITRNLEDISGKVQSENRIHKELDTAQSIQKNLLPLTPPNIPGLQVQAMTLSASEIGGDAYNFFEKDGRYFMYIGDSTGHGIPAGIVMVMVNLLIHTFIETSSSLTDLAIKVNQHLKPHMQTTMFMTLIFLEWNPTQSVFKWVGAGHEHLIHLKSKTGSIETYKAGGIALGMVPDNTSHTKEESFIMEADDYLVLYSDGIIDAKNINGEIYGLERLAQTVKAHASSQRTAQEVLKQIIDDVTRFMQGQVQLDDMTLIVIKKPLNQSTV